MAFRTLAFFLREVYANFRKNPLMILASMATVMLLVVICGGFLLVFLNLNAFKEEFSAQLELIVYLKPALTEQEILGLRSRLSQHPLVGETRFVSKDEALQKLKASMRQENLDLSGVTSNPLPDHFIVRARDVAATPTLAKEIEQFPGVMKDGVNFLGKYLDKFLALTRILRSVGLVIVALLIFTTIFIINNTIRLSVFSRRREIKIMELVGAAHWFIRGPFILEGMFYGLLGSLAAIFCLRTGYGSLIANVQQHLAFFHLVSNADLLGQLFLGLLGVGIVVGGMGSYLSVSKFLKL